MKSKTSSSDGSAKDTLFFNAVAMWLYITPGQVRMYPVRRIIVLSWLVPQTLNTKCNLDPRYFWTLYLKLAALEIYKPCFPLWIHCTCLLLIILLLGFWHKIYSADTRWWLSMGLFCNFFSMSRQPSFIMHTTKTVFPKSCKKQQWKFNLKK
jgi:hypothetical protein